MKDTPIYEEEDGTYYALYTRPKCIHWTLFEDANVK